MHENTIMTFALRSSEIVKNCMGFITGLPQGVFEVVVKKINTKRSVAQNRLYFTWINALMDYTGFTKDELHDRLRLRFLGTVERTLKVRLSSGEIKKIRLREIQSTKDLSVEKFSNYLDDIEELIHKTYDDFRLPCPEDYRVAQVGIYNKKTKKDEN